MSFINVQALISYRMEKSYESIKAAEIMLKNSMLTFSMNRIYYSMFYAVQAILAAKGVSFSKHGQVRGYFNRELIKTGILPKSLADPFLVVRDCSGSNIRPPESLFRLYQDPSSTVQ